VTAGTHTIRPTATYPCEKGFFCPSDINSNRIPCPVGFKCPSESMVNPTVCSTGLFYEKSCLNIAQTTEATCPNGFICR
jgi:hypothetical protein